MEECETRVELKRLGDEFLQLLHDEVNSCITIYNIDRLHALIVTVKNHVRSRHQEGEKNEKKE